MSGSSLTADEPLRCRESPVRGQGGRYLPRQPSVGFSSDSRLVSARRQTACARAHELDESRCDKLATTSLRIDERTHRLSQVRRLDRTLAMVRVPGFEHLNDPATLGIIALDLVDPVDGIATAKRQEWVPTPFDPILEAAERRPASRFAEFCLPHRQTVRAAPSRSAPRFSILPRKPDRFRPPAGEVFFALR